MRNILKEKLEKLPFGIGYRIINILTMRRFLTKRGITDIFIVRRKRRLEREESIRIKAAIAKHSFKKIILVYDNLSSGPTYGDYIYALMMARYFLAFDMPVLFYLVNGDNKHGWGYLDKAASDFHIEEQIFLANTFLNNPLVTIEKIVWSDMTMLLEDASKKEYLIPFEKQVKEREKVVAYFYTTLSHLLSDSKSYILDRFLLSFEEIKKNVEQVSGVNMSFPLAPYITFACRYSTLWGEERNTTEVEFVLFINYLKRLYPGHQIMVISDSLGCEYFKKTAQKNNITCLYCKDYTHSFMEDAVMVLGSKFYFQFKGGGMGVVPLFSRLPYEFIQKMNLETMWSKDRATPWADEDQLFINMVRLDKHYLNKGKIKYR